MLKPLMQKLSSRAGETLVEALVAMLVAAMALLMLAVAIGAGGNLIQVSRTQQQTYNQANTNLVTVNSAEASKASVTVTTKFVDSSLANSSQTVNVDYVVEPLPGGDDGVSYQVED